MAVTWKKVFVGFVGLGVCLGCRAKTSPNRGRTPSAVTATPQPKVSAVPGAIDSAQVPNPSLHNSPPTSSGSSNLALPLEDADFVVPRTTEGERVAFVLFLHGLGASGPLTRRLLELDRLAESKRFAFTAPSGPEDRRGRRYWNAPACCDFDRAGLDHKRMLTQLLRRASEDPRIDPARLFVYGFSNGAYMAHYLACVLESPLAGIVAVAGMPPPAREKCRPEQRLTVIQVHGSRDVIVPMQGGHLFGDSRYSAVEPLMTALQRWASILGCQERLPHRAGALDLVPHLAGEETLVHTWGHCRGTLTLFEITGGTHLSVNASGITKQVLDSLLGPTVTRPQD
jgi:poly(3-hydroxybutyrate) depolymerase